MPFESEIRRELVTLNKNLRDINIMLAHLVREQRRTNVMFMKAFKLSYDDVSKEDEEFKRKWA